MTDNSSIEKAVQEADPRDGFRIVVDKVGSWTAVHLAYFQDGEMADVPSWTTEGSRAIKLIETDDMTPQQHGEIARVRLFGEAICRFLNSGGSWEHMQSLLTMCHVTTSAAVMGDSDFKLMDSYINTDGENEHVFADEARNLALIWVERRFMETQRLDKFLREEADDDGT